ncbi:MAG: hypothetical protein R2851_05830 [Caldilineaceae bacterium]
MNKNVAYVQQFGQRVEGALRSGKRIRREISAYPPPIPACDAQFNYLLEQRNQVAQELSAVTAAQRDEANAGIAALVRLVETSLVLRPAVKQQLLATLSTETLPTETLPTE